MNPFGNQNDGGFGFAVAIRQLNPISISPGSIVAVVGAPFHDDPGKTDVGVAYVYRFDPGTGTWAQEATLKAADGAQFDEFSRALAIDDDGDTIVIGAHFDDDAGSNSGSVYVFQYDPVGMTWNQEVKLTAPNAAGGDQFGSSVSIISPPFSVTTTVLVGAPFRDDLGQDSGAAYVFTHDGATWDLGTMILATDGGSFDNFGFGVSLNGNAALIGAPFDDDEAVDAGAAYIFRNGATGWVEEDKVTSGSNAISGALFGEAVDLDGTVALISQRQEGGSGNGSAYLFNFDFFNPNNLWTLGLRLIPGTLFTGTDSYAQGVALNGGQAIIGQWNRDFVNEIGLGHSYFGVQDCDENGQSDLCEIAEQNMLDCNFNSLLDGCEISLGMQADCNGNGFIDSCEEELPDCDGNGISDCFEIGLGQVPDCNGNLYADACEVSDHWKVSTLFIDTRGITKGIWGGAASIINGKIYVSHGNRTTISSAIPSKLLSIYDIGSDTWDHTAPGAPFKRLDLCAGIASGKHYAIGGVLEDHTGTSVTNSVSELTPGAPPVWTMANSMPSARTAMGCASWNDEIFVVGGRTGINVGTGDTLSTLEVLIQGNPNPVWVTKTPMDIPVSECSATVAFNGKVYVFGGISSDFTVMDVVQVYDIATDSWTNSAANPELLTPMPTARTGAMAGVLGNKIVVFGGRVQSSILPVTTVEIYDPSTDTWSSGSELVIGARQMVQGVTWDATNIYAIGGLGLPGTSLFNNRIVQKLFPALPDCNNTGTPDVCELGPVAENDCDGNGVPDDCQRSACVGDINPCPGGSGEVNIDDLVAVLNAFGPCPGTLVTCLADIVPPGGNGEINIDDLVAVLNAFGPCTGGSSSGATGMLQVVKMDFSDGWVDASGALADPASNGLISAAWAVQDSQIDCYRLFAQVESPNSTLTYAGGGLNSGPGGMPEPLVLNPGKGAQFYIPIAGSYAPPNVALFSMAGDPNFQLEAFGTYLTFGMADGTPPVAMGNVNSLDGLLTGFVNAADVGWGVYGATAGQGVVPDGNGGWRVLIGQFAVPKGKTFTAAVRLAGDGIDVYATVNSGVTTLP